MTIKNYNRFTDKQFQKRTGNFWIFQQNRFECDAHPIMLRKEKSASPVKFLVSYQEKMMLTGLINATQVTERDTIRIAIFELAVKSDGAEGWREHCLSTTTQRNHTSRETEVSIRIPKKEKEQLKALASKLGLTEKETLRLAVIWLSQDIKNGKIQSLTDSPKIDQDVLRKEWSASYDGSGSKTVKLREAGNAAYQAAAEEGERIKRERYELRGAYMSSMTYEAQGAMPAFVSGFDDNGNWIINLDVVDEAIRNDERSTIKEFAEEYLDLKTGYISYYTDVKGYDLEMAEVLAESMLSETTVVEQTTQDKTEIESRYQIQIPESFNKAFDTSRDSEIVQRYLNDKKTAEENDKKITAEMQSFQNYQDYLSQRHKS